MKKYILTISSILFATLSSFGQIFEHLSLSQQPSDKIFLSLAYSKVVNPMAIGQGFTYFVENLTGKDLDVYFDIVAKTVCGNEVVDKAVNSLKPYEKSGGGSEVLGDAMISYVKKQDCEGNQITYQDNGKTLTGINRIASLQIRNLVVKEVNIPNSDRSTSSQVNSSNTTAESNTSQQQIADQQKVEAEKRSQAQIAFQQQQNAYNQRQELENQQRQQLAKQKELQEEQRKRNEQTAKEVAQGTADIAKALSSIKRDKNLDVEASDNGGLWLNIGYSKPNNNDAACYSNGLKVGINFTGWEHKHVKFSVDMGIDVGDKNDLSFYADKFGVSESEIASAGRIISFHVLPSFGPYLYRNPSKNTYLALQALVGVTAFEAPSFVATGDNYWLTMDNGNTVIFTYGGNLIFYKNNFSLSLNYYLTNDKYITWSYGQYGAGHIKDNDGTINLSSISITLGFRLL